ncbi:hypothetical protein [Flindersiella endophytica]
MAVTYEQAREILRAELEPSWTHGAFCLDDRQIVENDELFVFSVGAREWLVDGDHDYMLIGEVPVVTKADGTAGSRASIEIAMDAGVVTRPNPSPTLRI